MAIVYSGKSFSGVMNDTANYYYTDADCNAKIGAGEKFYVELRATNVVSTPQITVGLDSSNDNVNWVTRNVTAQPSRDDAGVARGQRGARCGRSRTSARPVRS